MSGEGTTISYSHPWLSFHVFFLHSFIFTHTGIVSVEPDLLELDFMPPPLTYFPPLTLEYDLSVSIFFIMVAAYL